MSDPLELPSVTIGMPLYQNARTIRRAIGSLQAQSFASFELIASDDGSRDGTADIVDELAAQDTRIRVVRQPKNLNYGNFRYVLREARAPFFMFAAGDDWWEPTFIERCLEALNGTPGAVCVAARTQMHPDQGSPYLSTATAPLRGPLPERVAAFLANPSDNSRMYGLYRTAAAQASFPANDFFAYDWAFSAHSLMFGEYLELSEALLHREVTAHGRYFDYVRRDASRLIDRLFPLRPLNRYLRQLAGFPQTAEVKRNLRWLNIYMHGEYVARHFPRMNLLYGRVVQRALHRWPRFFPASPEGSFSS